MSHGSFQRILIVSVIIRKLKSTDLCLKATKLGGFVAS